MPPWCCSHVTQTYHAADMDQTRTRICKPNLPSRGLHSLGTGYGKRNPNLPCGPIVAAPVSQTYRQRPTHFGDSDELLEELASHQAPCRVRSVVEHASCPGARPLSSFGDARFVPARRSYHQTIGDKAMLAPARSCHHDGRQHGAVPSSSPVSQTYLLTRWRSPDGQGVLRPD